MTPRTVANALSAMLLLPLVSTAGNITFIDLTDTITLSDDTGRTQNFMCQGETCSVVLLPPAGTNGVQANTAPSLFSWIEPGTNMLSDQFCGAQQCCFSPQQAFISFQSDIDGVSLGTCPVGVTCGVENGQVQLAFTINWVNVDRQVFATDNINLQSDIGEVPEPSSGVLLVAGIGGITLLRRLQTTNRRRF